MIFNSIFSSALWAKNSIEFFGFNLHADNDEIILTSEGYATKAGCEHGIQSVKTNASSQEQYELHISEDDRFYFNLKASNSQVIGTSTMHETEAARVAGMESVTIHAPEAIIDDQSYEDNDETFKE